MRHLVALCRNAFVVSILPALLGAEGLATTDTSRYDALRNHIHAELAKANGAGLAVAIIEDGRVTFAEGFGNKSFEGSDPITAETLFDIQSATKSVTGAAAMRLIQDGKLDLDDPVTKYVPFFSVNPPYNPQAITVRQILNMTAAYPTTPKGYDPSALTFDDTKVTGLSQFFQHFTSVDLLTPPGALWNYTNSGYALAGLIVEAASGQDYSSYVADHVLKPAGMTSATFDHATAHERNHVFNSKIENGVKQVEDPTIDQDSYSGRPYCGLFASVLDLAHFGEMLLHDGGDVMNATYAAEMMSPQASKGYPGRYYGYGVHLIKTPYRIGDQKQDEPGDMVVYVSGNGNVGQNSKVYLDPKRKFGVVVLSNDGTVDSASILDKAFKLFLGKELQPLSATLPPSQWSTFVGTYVDPVFFGTMVVTLDQGHLMINFTDSSYQSEMLPYPGNHGAGTFFFIPPPNLLTLPTGFKFDGNFWQEFDGQSPPYFVTRFGVGTKTQ